MACTILGTEPPRAAGMPGQLSRSQHANSCPTASRASSCGILHRTSFLRSINTRRPSTEEAARILPPRASSSGEGSSSGGSRNPVESDALRPSGDLDVAVFRFSLGLPFLDDKYVPRAVGAILGSLLVVNHVLTRDVTPAQQVSEAVGGSLAILSILVPTLESRLQELKGGRRATSSSDSGGRSGLARRLFLLSPALTGEAQQEVAWASYALLKNTNTMALLLLSKDRILCARGMFCSSEEPQSSEPAATVAAAASGAAQQLDFVQGLIGPLVAGTGKGGWGEALGLVGGSEGGQLYLPTLPGAWDALQAVCPGAASVLVSFLHDPSGSQGAANLEEQPNLGSKSPETPILLLVSGLPRAFSARDRVWVQGIASKLGSSGHL